MKQLSREEILSMTMDLCRRYKTDHAVAILNTSSENTLRFALNRPTQHMGNEVLSLSIAVAKNCQEAMITTNCVSTNQLDSAVQEVLKLAEYAPQNPEFIGPVCQQEYNETKTWFNSTAQLNHNDITSAVNVMCEHAKTKHVDLFGNFGVIKGLLSIKNTEGLSLEQPYTEVKVNVTGRTKQGGSSRVMTKEGDWNYIVPLKISETATDVAIRSSNPHTINPGKYTVILSPNAVLELLMYLVFAMDARESELGQSYFSNAKGGTRTGERLFDPLVTISSLYDHPRMPTMPFGTAFGSGGSSVGMLFSYGLPMQNRTWIEKGVVKSLRYSPYWAWKNKKLPTGYPQNIVMDGSVTPEDEIIKDTKKGIYISSFWYTSSTNMNTLSVTGLTRDGVFYIENGQIQRPLVNFRFNDSLVHVLNQISAIGLSEKAEGEYISGIAPPLRVDAFNLSSISEAV
ncbi:hypothetical protein JW979_10450 [bacterium]|nr:hypothetical protein [candidate division CSSED10-310 bacterium]